ncbi:MAG: A24 family peptidase [bacterium]|nr:A24 family peptidase [bacterium]
MAPWPVALYLCILGLFLGSFALTTGQRLLAGASLLQRSTCPHCSKPIGPIGLFPVLGWLLLKGRCRHCAAPIPLLHPFSEALAGLAALILWWVTGDFWLSLYWLCLGAGLLLISWLDLISGQIYTLPIMGLLFLQALWYGLVDPTGLVDGLIGLLVGAGLFHWISTLFLAIRGKPGLGEGDASLMGLLGFALGYQAILPIVFLSSLLGLVIGGGWLAFKRQGLSQAIPFGPFLALATGVFAIAPNIWQKLFHL